ncbi:hypothetical protein PIB30_074952 [Stylosanthes scabra]|uniref:Cystatin domain-containing protein n=1 Tax=Stylosanthes scabra TaxID=79078 RepID=A0ABU6ZNN4_9FABA|nr:hypothetical protein [Stylosanthes scabra]
MAAVTLTIIPFFTALCLLSTVSCRMIVVGQATEIADVKANKEVQELGKFAVEKYNESLRLWQQIHFNGGDEEVQGQEKLQFEEVLEAKQQVVSGTKYYLKISAKTKTENDVPKMFSSVVVVKPWLRSKQLVHFRPYSSSSSSQ